MMKFTNLVNFILSRNSIVTEDKETLFTKNRTVLGMLFLPFYIVGMIYLQVCIIIHLILVDIFDYIEESTIKKKVTK